ncbi:hypothetical protein EVAR_87044_1 [Eumeta japonica]|uniref:Uncharacterized protein n=1 Tax=Eumeta variegata TaxID=151549 RepID=A0A4C1SUQ2_EUMVA|nr:hypothetical protein EVAR_87044_1 [Eumeta japonica]
MRLAREPGSQAAGAGNEFKTCREFRFDNEMTQLTLCSLVSSDIQNDLIKSIAQVIRDEIKSEINFMKFVSVIADETPDISHREQMSVIFRYLTKTGIEERFVAIEHLLLDIRLNIDFHEARFWATHRVQWPATSTRRRGVRREAVPPADLLLRRSYDVKMIKMLFLSHYTTFV